MSRVIGIVEWYNDDKGFGMINTEEHERAFVTFEDLRSQFGDRMNPGSVVELCTEVDEFWRVYARDVIVPDVLFDFPLLYGNEEFDEFQEDRFFIAEVYVNFITKFKETPFYDELRSVFTGRALNMLFKASTFMELCKFDIGYVYNYDVDYWASEIVNEIVSLTNIENMLSEVRSGRGMLDLFSEGG